MEHNKQSVRKDHFVAGGRVLQIAGDLSAGIEQQVGGSRQTGVRPDAPPLARYRSGDVALGDLASLLESSAAARRSDSFAEAFAR